MITAFYIAIVIESVFFTIIARNYFNNVLLIKFSKGEEWNYYIVYFVYFFILQFYLKSILLKTLLLLVGTTILTLKAYHGTKKRILFYTILLILYWQGIAILLICFSGWFDLHLFSIKHFNCIICIAVKLMLCNTFVCLFSYGRTSVNEDTRRISKKVIMLSLCSLCTAFVLVFCFVNEDNDYILMSCICVPLILAMNFILIKVFETQNAMLAMVHQKDLYRHQLDLIQSTESEYKTIRHDLKNHFVVISNLLDKEECNAAKEYINNFFQRYENKEQFCKTGNTTVDSLVNYKLRPLLLDSNLYLNCDIVIPKSLDIETFDLTVILGNLIDNAVEAVEKIPKDRKRHLCITLKYDRFRLMIKIKNSYNGEIIKKDKYFVSNKKDDGLCHGLGLKSVYSVVKRHDGYFGIEYDDLDFIATVILYDSSRAQITQGGTIEGK